MFFGKPVKTVSAREVQIGIREGAICLIDVREPHEYKSAAIPGAKLVPLSSFSPAKIENPEGREIVIHCQSGMRSAQAAQICIKAGVPVANMAGGIMAWQQAGYPIVAGA